MSIEAGASATSAKTAVAENHGVKAKAQSGGEDAAITGGGFLAMLTALAPPVTVGAPDPAAEQPSEAADTQAQPAAASVLLPQDLPNELALLLAQASQGGADKAGVVSAGPALRARPGAGLAALVAGAEKPEPVLATAVGPQGIGDLMQNVDPSIDQGTPTLSARTSKNGGAGLQSGAQDSRTESIALKQSALGDFVAREATLSETRVSSALAESLLRQAERAPAKSSAASDRTGVEGLWGQAGVPGASRADAPSVLTNPALPTLEAKVANTVSYWVTQGVQNAALKFDGLGDEPVEVNISLKGREAHIGFRTDQPEIRQILEGALVHLKNLLASEGLLLSGVSVGASGQDGKGTPQQQPRPGARPASIATPDAESGQNQQRVSHAVGRAVDIFV